MILWVVNCAHLTGDAGRHSTGRRECHHELFLRRPSPDLLLHRELSQIKFLEKHAWMFNDVDPQCRKPSPSVNHERALKLDIPGMGIHLPSYIPHIGDFLDQMDPMVHVHPIFYASFMLYLRVRTLVENPIWRLRPLVKMIQTDVDMFSQYVCTHA